MLIQPIRMRVISIDENDSLLFGEGLTPDYYLFYLQHKDAFRCMWQDQSPGFWVRCVISFRSFMWQRGLVDDAKFDDPQTKLLALKRSEDAFCNLVTFLTGNKISAVCAFIEDTCVVASNHHQMIHIFDSSHAFDPFYNKSTRSAFRNLFGDPTFKDSLVTMVGGINIYLHFAMVLIKILKRWLTSEERSSTWKPPSFFLESDAPYIFEGFLKERFGKQLFELIGVQRDNLSWWDKIDMEQAQNLRQRPNPQADVVEGKLLPWQMAADDPEMGAVTDLGIKVAHLLWMYYSQSPFLVSSTPEPQEESLSVTLHEIPAFQSCYYIYYSIFGPRFHSSVCKIVDSIRSKSEKKMVEEMNKNQRPSGKKAFLRNNRKQINDDFIAVMKKNSLYENRTYSIDKFIRKWEGIYNFSYSFGRDAEKNLLYICMDMPYLNTYLEKSMNKLLDLEYNFIPFKIFPILKELHQPLERILVLFKETKLLLLASIALMEEIQRLEGCDSPWLSRLKYHKELHHILPKFDQSINKLGQLALRLLDTLLQQAWSKQERKTGRCNPGRTRVNPRFHNLGAVPDLERLFVDNHRHLVFWLNMNEVPDMNKRHTHFKEVYKILKAYLAKMLDKEQCKKWDSQVEPIDDAREFTEVEEMIFAKLKLTSHIKDLKCQQAELYTTVKSLTEDSYLDEETAKQINNWLKKLNLPGNSSDKNDNRLKDVIYLRRVGNLYILAKSIINIYPFPRNKRNSFNQIFQDECNHLLLASACKFVRSVQEILNTDRSQFVPCPPTKCFQAIQDFMYKFSWEPVTFCPKDIVSGLDEFRSKLWANTPETRNKDSDNDKDMDAGKEDNDSKASSSSIDVMPYLAKLKISSIDFWTKQKFNYWINVFEGKLFELMKKVADKYFQLGENYSECAKKTSICKFPHWHTLYVHLREELAHIRQQIADDKPYAYQNKNDLIRIARLSQLTYHRLRWIESEVDKWCADPASLRYRPQVQPSINSGSLVQRYATARIRFMWADSLLCGKLSIFSHQSGIFSLRNDLMKLFDNWDQFIESVLFHDLTFWNDLGDTMLDFTELTERMTDYLETFKQHCIFVWNEPLTLCDPDAGDYAHHDMRHARLVTLALLRFHVVSYYIYLTLTSDKYLKNFPHKHRLVLEYIIYTLQRVQDKNLDPLDDKLGNSLWNTIDRIWKEVQACVPACKKDPGLVNLLPTYIVGETDSWKKLVGDYIYGRHDRIAAKLDINPREACSVPQSEPTDKKHKKKSKNKRRPPLPQDVDTCPVVDCIQINILHCTESFCVDTTDSFEEGQPSEDKQPIAEKGSSVGCADETAQSEGGTDSPLDTCTLFTKETDKTRPKKGRNRAKKGKGKANSEAADEHLSSLNSNNTREMVSGPVTNPESKPRGNTNLDAVGSTDEVTLCETFSKATVGSSDERSGPVPEKDCDKKELSTTLSMSVMAPNVTKTKPRGLRSCANCLLKEPSPFFYQKCRLCKTQKMKLVRFYCSRECQVAHWKAVHQAEHAEHTAQTSAH